MPDEPQTILVVDDDSIVRKTATVVLERGGFRVHGSRSGARGYECFMEHPDEIGLVLTDVVMPLMSGPEMVEMILRQRPNVKVLFMTGYSAIAVLPDLYSKRYGVLGKPFTPAALLHAVRNCLLECV